MIFLCPYSASVNYVLEIRGTNILTLWYTNPCIWLKWTEEKKEKSL